MRISDWSSDVCSSDLWERESPKPSRSSPNPPISRNGPGRASASRHVDRACGGRVGHRAILSPSIRAPARAPVRRAVPPPAASHREIGRAHVTPVTNAHLVCRLLLEKKKQDTYHTITQHTPNIT